MRYRALSPTGDYLFGSSLAGFYIDVPQAVAQAVTTRLRLNLGEWFLDTTDGTPWRTQVLGPRTAATRDLVVKSRVLGTPGLLALTSYQSQVDDATRAFTVQLTVNTAYGVTGTVAVSTPGY